MRHATDNCLIGEAFSKSSRVQLLHPPSKFAITWATLKSIAAANPSWKAS